MNYSNLPDFSLKMFDSKPKVLDVEVDVENIEASFGHPRENIESQFSWKEKAREKMDKDPGKHFPCFFFICQRC